MFYAECFFNPDVFTLLFNKCHLYELHQQELFCVFGYSAIFKMKINNRKKNKSKLNLCSVSQSAQFSTQHTGVTTLNDLITSKRIYDLYLIFNNLLLKLID